MTFPDILIGFAVASFLALAWLICMALRAPIGFETWHGLRIGTPTYDPVDEHAEIERAIKLGGAGTVFHADFTNAKGPAEHV